MSQAQSRPADPHPTDRRQVSSISSPGKVVVTQQNYGHSTDMRSKSITVRQGEDNFLVLTTTLLFLSEMSKTAPDIPSITLSLLGGSLLKVLHVQLL